MKYSGTNTENLLGILESPKQKSHRERISKTQTWHNYSRSGSCSESTASWNHESIVNPPLQNPNGPITGPEHAMQFDLFAELSPFDGYENKVTARPMYSKHLFAYRTTSQDT